MATLRPDRLTPRLRRGLAIVARCLGDAGVGLVVGGSAMLRCRGLDVTVGDIDVCVDGSQLDAVLASLGLDHSAVLHDPPTPWVSGWFLRTEVGAGEDAVAVDIIGDLAIEVDGEVAHFPGIWNDTVEFEDLTVAFDSMDHWYHLYRVHNPARARLIVAVAEPGDLERAALELGI